MHCTVALLVVLEATARKSHTILLGFQSEFALIFIFVKAAGFGMMVYVTNKKEQMLLWHLSILTSGFEFRGQAIKKQKQKIIFLKIFFHLYIHQLFSTDATIALKVFEIIFKSMKTRTHVPRIVKLARQ